MHTILWHDDGNGITQFAIARPLWLDGSGEPKNVPLSDAIMLARVAAVEDVVAAALIPEDLDRRVKHNRIPMPSGMLTLRHADRLDVGAYAYWIAAGSEAELTEYSPGSHNIDVYCFLTKARLKAGEPIAICPGTPGRSCGTIYKRSAWEAMLTQPDFRCANCEFDPKAPVWRPPAGVAARRLDDVFQLLGIGGA